MDLRFQKGNDTRGIIICMWLRKMEAVDRECVEHTQHVAHILSRWLLGHAPQNNFANLASEIKFGNNFG